MSEKAGILERTATVRGPSGAANSVTPLTFRFAHNGAQYPEPERLMSNKPVNGNGRQPARDRIHAEMLDSFEEELELEIDDDRLDALTNELSGHPASGDRGPHASISRSCSGCRASWSSCRTGCSTTSSRSW